MAYTAKDYSALTGMPGFSDTLLNNHFTLYQGYVTNTNRLLEALSSLLNSEKAEAPSSQYAELKRRLGFEFDGMRLHEYYFENLGGKTPIAQSSRLAKLLAGEFGTLEAWEKDFRATGAMRGVGWAILYQDSPAGRFSNVWVNEHQANHWAGCQPILVMDAWEHAYMLDYGIKRAGYIEAFLKNVNWPAVEARLK
jgi:Fe-Mn family superoxide dismutase